MKEGTDLCLQRLGCGEMPSVMFQERVLYFGDDRYLCHKIPTFVGT